MSGRIDRNISGPGGLIKRQGGWASKRADEKSAAPGKKTQQVREKGVNRKQPSLAVKVRRKWDSAKYRLLGRFDIYRRFHEVPLGLYVDAYV